MKNADLWVVLVEKCGNTNQFQVSVAKQPQFQRGVGKGLLSLGSFFCRSHECFGGLGVGDFTNTQLHNGGGYFCVKIDHCFCFKCLLHITALCIEL